MGELMNEKQSNSVVDQVKDGIVDLIISGKLNPGDKLPTESELSTQFGAGRNSVREAIKILQAYGVVYIKRADGTYVSENYTQSMLDPMLYSLILQENSRDDFVGLRTMIDIGVMNVIIRRKDISKFLPRIYLTFGELSAELHSENPDPERVMELDNLFHYELASAAQNPMIQTIAEYINRLTLPTRLETTRRRIAAGDAESLVELHRELINVIESRKVEDIARAVNDHYIYWK